jgi:hypothetical protein
MGDENNQKVPLEHKHVVCHLGSANIWLLILTVSPRQSAL